MIAIAKNFVALSRDSLRNARFIYVSLTVSLIALPYHAGAEPQRKYGVTVNPDIQQRRERRTNLVDTRRADSERVQRVRKQMADEDARADHINMVTDAITATPQGQTRKAQQEVIRKGMDSVGLCSSCRFTRDADKRAANRRQAQLIIRDEKTSAKKPQWKRAAERTSAINRMLEQGCQTRTPEGYTKRNGRMTYQTGSAPKGAGCYTGSTRSRNTEQGRASVVRPK